MKKEKELTKKYYGIVDVNYKNSLDYYQEKHFLIEKKVAVEKKELELIKGKIIQKPIYLETNHHQKVKAYRDKFYYISDDIYLEYLNHLKKQLENLLSNINEEIVLKFIKIKLNLFLENEEKIKFLKKTYTEHIDSFMDENRNHFLKSYNYDDQVNLLLEICFDFIQSSINYLEGYCMPNENSSDVRNAKAFIDNKIIVLFCREKIQEIENLSNTKKTNIVNDLTLPQRIILIDRIRVIDVDDWENLDNTKKASILSLITGNSKETIRKIIPKVDSKVKDDIERIDRIIKKELGH